MRVGFYQLIKDGHDIPVGMLDDVETQLAIPPDQFCQVMGNELAELLWTEEGALVETVIGA
jgi:hypothetical protein